MPDDSAQAAIATAFKPRSVAMAGISTNSKSGWGGGTMFLRGTKHMGRLERVFAINPRGGELEDGTKLYTSLAEVPGEVDFLISAVPASAILGLVEEAVAKHVKVMHLFTAGFGETGNEERAELERRLMTRIREAGIRLIGPNCMGIHSPLGGISWMDDSDATPGRVGMLSQSGANASEVVNEGKRRGVRFSNVVSFGNATDLNESDFLEFLAGDDDTDLVLAYLEGIKDGPRFLRTARALGTHKPLIVLKGGLTEAGSRAASSHTGSLAGSAQIWEAVRKQAGFLRADGVDELLDLAVTIERLGAVAGPRAAVLGGGGGTSVLAADTCDREGIRVPWLSERTQRALSEFTPIAGTSVRNPVDAGFLFNPDELSKALQTVAEDENIDWLLLHTGMDGGFGRRAGGNQAEQFATNLGNAMEGLRKPVAVAIRPPRSIDGFHATTELQQRLNDAGVATYSSIEACARAVRRYLDWKARWDRA